MCYGNLDVKVGREEIEEHIKQWKIYYRERPWLGVCFS